MSIDGKNNQRLSLKSNNIMIIIAR